VIGAVSREAGINLIMTFPKSINAKKFKVFLEELRNKYPFNNMVLVLDNLSLHKSKLSVERMNELGFRHCWTPPYSPEYNGIEEVWS
jgi:transposase